MFRRENAVNKKHKRTIRILSIFVLCHFFTVSKLQMPPPKIYNIKEPLNLARLRLAKPTNKNGSHFIKTLDVDDPIYFLGPKCLTKQGFVKSGKKIFCDFVFSNEDSEFLTWLENLEESARKSIYANRETWFETPLDEHDIESSMSSAYKPYKSGKYFIVRANVPTALDKINIKIYDENEQETDPENIKENTRVLAVLEFQGIRCSVRSFQFEIELKQLLIVEPEKLFETCIIGKSKPNISSHEHIGIPSGYSDQLRDSSIHPSDISSQPGKETKNLIFSNETSLEESFNSDALTNAHRVMSSNSHRLMNCPLPDTTTSMLTSSDSIPQKESEPQIFANQEADGALSENKDPELETTKDINTVSVSIDNTNLEMPVEIFDADFALENITDSNTDKEPPLRLKTRNDVYYKLYKEMRQRAKEAKREALANYLEAKRIKNTYLLEDVSESESDEDRPENYLV